MPASRTNNHTPEKVYFSPSEARKILHCGKATLRALTAQMGADCGRKGGKGWRRYSVKEINKMMELRKFKK